MKTVHRKFVSTGALLGALALTGPHLLVAQPAPGQPGGERGGPGGVMRSMPIITALDADQNNEIDAAELDKAAAALRKLDKNQDGKLTEDELRPDFGGRGGGPGGPPPRGGPGGPQFGGRGGPGGPGGMMRFFPILAALDTDQSGEIDSKEIENSKLALGKLDKNSDQKLSEVELRPAFGGRGGGPGGPGGFGPSGGGPSAAETVKRMMEWDKDTDGKLSAAELPNRMESLMARADTDKDGGITRDELLQLMQLEQGTAANSGPPGGAPQRP